MPFTTRPSRTSGDRRWSRLAVWLRRPSQRSDPKEIAENSAIRGAGFLRDESTRRNVRPQLDGHGERDAMLSRGRGRVGAARRPSARNGKCVVNAPRPPDSLERSRWTTDRSRTPACSTDVRHLTSVAGRKPRQNSIRAEASLSGPPRPRNNHCSPTQMQSNGPRGMGDQWAVPTRSELVLEENARRRGSTIASRGPTEDAAHGIDDANLGADHQSLMTTDGIRVPAPSSRSERYS